MAAAAASHSPNVRWTMPTSPPASASAWAITRPSPLAPPVISARRPSSRNISNTFLSAFLGTLLSWFSIALVLHRVRPSDAARAAGHGHDPAFQVQLNPAPPSARRVAAVHHNDGSGEKTRQVAGHISEETGHLLRRRNSSDRVIVFQHRPIFFRIARRIRRAMHDRRVHRAATDRVHA